MSAGTTGSRAALDDVVERWGERQRLWVCATSLAACRGELSVAGVDPRWWRYVVHVESVRGVWRAPLLDLGYPLGQRGALLRVELADMVDRGGLVRVSFGEVRDVLAGRPPGAAS